MFLTDEALAQLTGLQRPSAMCRWLEREGIPFVVAADGKPRVLIARNPELSAAVESAKAMHKNVSGVLAAILPPSQWYLLQTP